METKLREDKKCPKCGKGFMKVVHKTAPLNMRSQDMPMQAQCDNRECGYMDDYSKFYPRGDRHQA